MFDFSFDLFGIDGTSQLLFDGMISGLIIGMLAMGIVLVYRSTRVINFAVGNMGIVGAALLPLMTARYGFPFWPSLAASLAVGTLFGSVIELTVIRRLFRAPRVTVLVATVGIAQLAQAIVFAYPEVNAPGENYPVAITKNWDDLLGLRISGAKLTILIVVPILALLLGLLLNKSTFGKAVAASADNTDLARLSTVNPKLVSTFVWTVAGFLATLSMIMLSGSSGSIGGLANLGPITLGKAMVAAVLAGMVSFPRALIAGVSLGVVQALFDFNALNSNAPGFLQERAVIDVVLFLLVVGAVYFQSRSTGDDGVFSFSPKVRPVPEQLKQLWWVRHLTHILMAALLVFALALPLIATSSLRHFLYATVVCFAICGMSVTVITGWAGQLSLSQMSFAGIGALLSASFNRGFQMDVWLLDFEAPGLPYFVSMIVAAVAVAGLAAIIGAGSLRVRGLLLAVTTFVFALASTSYLYRRPILSGGESSSVQFRRGNLFGLELSSQRRYYYLCLVVLLVVLAVIGRLRRYGAGRAIIAVRDNPDTAAAYTVSPIATKISAFALAGGIASLGGALLAGAIQSIPFTERFFLVADSLKLIGIVVIGGLGSVLGAVLGAMWVWGIPAMFPGNDLAPLLTSSIGLLLVVMYLPGGLAQLGYGLRGMILDWADKRLDLGDPVKSVTVTPTSLGRGARAQSDDAVLVASGVSVRFGGNIAVNDVAIEVRPGEIVGLIGTNGAGKSTFMNAVGGYVPATGSVVFMGSEISGLSSSERARRGLGRTFQSASLFPELTVRETVQVALEARGRSKLLSTALFLPASTRAERTKRAEAGELIDYLGLGRFADSYVADLSTGTRRIVELCGLLAVRAELLCLDEPTAGLAQRETEAFGPLLVDIRAELDASMLIIEHDMPLIMAMSDRVYCLEAGAVIAEGDPATVRNDPLVIASYLGTDERAIARSDS